MALPEKPTSLLGNAEHFKGEDQILSEILEQRTMIQAWYKRACFYFGLWSHILVSPTHPGFADSRFASCLSRLWDVRDWLYQIHCGFGSDTTHCNSCCLCVGAYVTETCWDLVSSMELWCCWESYNLLPMWAMEAANDELSKDVDSTVASGQVWNFPWPGRRWICKARWIAWHGGKSGPPPGNWHVPCQRVVGKMSFLFHRWIYS